MVFITKIEINVSVVFHDFKGFYLCLFIIEFILITFEL